MKVTLLHHTPLHIVAGAIRTCWASQAKSDSKSDPKCPDCGSDYLEFQPQPLDYYLCSNCGHEVYNPDYSLVIGPDDMALIDRIGNKMKHESVKNHMTYNFYFEGITTKTLLALTRHDVGVEFSVQSTRYTCSRELKHEEPFCTFT